MNEDTSQALCRSSQALHVSITVFEGVSDKWHQVPLAGWWLPIACQKCADCPNVPNTYTTMQVDSSEFPDASRSWGEPRSSQHTLPCCRAYKSFGDPKCCYGGHWDQFPEFTAYSFHILSLACRKNGEMVCFLFRPFIPPVLCAYAITYRGCSEEAWQPRVDKR